MPYLATLCDRCHRVDLVSLDAIGKGTPLCRACDGALRILPSCSYADKDVSLFRELSDLVGEGGISPAEAEVSAREIAHALSAGAHGAWWDRLSVRMPGLLPVQLVIGGNRAARERALRMFKTIFAALSTSHRSGYVPSAAASRAASRRQA